MSIPLGHKLKIMKRIKDLRRERGMAVPESRQGGSRPSNVSQPVTKRTDLEELPDPTNGALTSGSETKKRLPSGAGTNTKANGGNSLLEGAYDEAASHLEFLDALNAWRTGTKAPAPKRV
jgi:hypothetical protein